MAATAIDETKLPRWDVQKLYGYADLNDAVYRKDFDTLNQRSKDFHDKYYGELEGSFEAALAEYSEINQKYRDMDQFVGSVQSIHRDDNEVMKGYSAYNTKRGEIHGEYMEWFTLQIMRLSHETINDWLSKSARVKSVEPWLKNIRELAPHVLSEEVEKALTLRENWFGATPVVEYFSNMLVKAKYRFPKALMHAEAPEALADAPADAPAGSPPLTTSTITPSSISSPGSCSPNDYVELNEPRLLNYLMDPNWKVRAAALEIFNEGLATNQINHFSCISLNQVAGKEAIENKVRKWPAVRSARNLSNQLSDDVVEALLKTVREEGVKINKRFYLLKRKILEKKTGRKDFTWADRNAPLGLKATNQAGEGVGSGGKKYEWPQCVEVVNRSFDEFSVMFSKMFMELVNEGRIDAPASAGKRGGAFCMLGTPTVGPVVFTNYLGKDEDVSTVAHECGHAIHGALTYQQPFLMQDPATAIAEVASIFGEMLVFKKLLLEEPSVEAKLEKLMEKLNSIMNTVVRQISFDRFEELVHTAKQAGFVSEEDMTKFWRQATEEFYGEEGEVFTSMQHLNNLWSYVPHFHELPFYVYSYAFADLTVGTLYALYEKNVFPSDREATLEQAAAHPTAGSAKKSFQARFINLLSSGSSKSFVEMVSEFDLNGASPDYWKMAFVDYIQPLLEQAEKLADQLPSH